MRAILCVSHFAVADFEHVRIVPRAGSSRFGMLLIGIVQDLEHACPLVLNVAGCAPQVASGRSPSPRLLLSPVADAEHYRPPALRQRLAELRVLFLWIETFSMAPIDLDVVDSPRGVRSGVLQFVIEATGPLLTSHRPCVGVDSKLQ